MLCVSLYVYTYMGTRVYVYVEVKREYWASFSITFHCGPTGSPLTLKLINWTGLASQQALGLPYFCFPRV